MNSPKSGYPVANQYLITTYEGGTLVEYFQSYRSVIVKQVYGKNPKTYLDRDYWNYSRTTGKYRNQYLGENTAETRKKIKSGEYILTNLN